MVIVQTTTGYEYWDCNLDVWLDTFKGNVWFVPGTDVEAQYHYWVQ